MEAHAECLRVCIVLRDTTPMYWDPRLVLHVWPVDTPHLWVLTRVFRVLPDLCQLLVVVYVAYVRRASMRPQTSKHV